MKAVRWIGSVTCLVALASAEKPASACGGLFCDGPTPARPMVMPVDQKGENILFVLDGKSVEAHVQIQYKGEPSRFAWIVPMPAVPTVTVGSEQLFTNLLQGTVPRYGYVIQQDSCPCYTCNTGAPSGFLAGAGGSTSASPRTSADGGVNVIFQKSVGSFEVTALQGHTATEVLDWLSANGYQGISTAPAILNKYVQKGSVFVAVKLTAGAGNDSIHPLVFKYTGTEPCIPLELTAVAAVEDMGVRAFFLGNSRVVSTNYDHVTLNATRVDWSLMGKNYDGVVSQAVDEAGGHAFVTEYAGPTGVVGNFFVNPQWDDTAFVGLSPQGVLDELRAQGLFSCYQTTSSDPDASVCTANHPLVPSLLHEFMPPPPGVRDDAYYSCVSCYSQDASAFDSQKLAGALRDRIIEPARHAAAILARWPYLTRLYTTISPQEMNLDPLFEARTDLTNIPAMTATATWRRTMTLASGFTLPTGQVVALDNSLWPAFTGAMPWAAKIDRYPAGKAAEVVTDNSTTVADQLDKWNKSQGWPLPPPNCPPPPTNIGQGGTGGTFTTLPVGDVFSGGSRGHLPDAGAGASSAAKQSSDSGCAVSAARTSSPRTAWLAVMAALAVLGVRRRAGVRPRSAQ